MNERLDDFLCHLRNSVARLVFGRDDVTNAEVKVVQHALRDMGVYEMAHKLVGDEVGAIFTAPNGEDGR